ncbi:hypothetical protein [Halohasta salina]|uniref:hypothetical protein n=1 Tax=Halohasta salina TaxID=2961621 RepID=UPI0020A5E8D1|nr:hypothetical protein [Halohasta salina]
MTDAVQVHLHCTMWGAFPLRLADVLFRSDRLVIVVYDYLTPLDLAMRSPSQRGRAFVDRIENEGVAAALTAAEDVTELPYEELETVRVYDGGRVGREAVSIQSSDGYSRIVRVHSAVDLDGFVEAVRSVLSGYAVAVKRRDGIAFEFNGLLGRLSRV